MCLQGDFERQQVATRHFAAQFQHPHNQFHQFGFAAQFAPTNSEHRFACEVGVLVEFLAIEGFGEVAGDDKASEVIEVRDVALFKAQLRNGRRKRLHLFFPLPQQCRFLCQHPRQACNGLLLGFGGFWDGQVFKN